MEIKNLFDASVTQEIIVRINKLTPQSQRQWGKMDVAQMLAHCQMPLGMATGDHKLKGGFFLKLISPLFKKQLYNDKHFKHDLPTDKSYKIANPPDFQNEKLNLIAMINDFLEITMSGEPHPLFGKLAKEKWSRRIWKHLDHHLQQLLFKSINNTSN